MRRASVIGLVALGLLALGLGRGPLADWLLPVPRGEQELARAESALLQGRLHAADGSGALERYSALLARDPDNSTARRGLQAVARAAAARTERALARADIEAAAAALEIAEAAGLAPAVLAAYRARMRLGEDSEAALAQAIARARAALDADDLDSGPDSALAIYLDVLERDPGNAIAVNGRDEVLARLLRAALVQARAGEPAAALARIERVAALAPQHVELPAARAALAAVVGDVDDSLQLRALAVALAEGRLDAARALYQAMPARLRASPELRPLIAGLAAASARRAVVEAVRGRVAASERALAQALAFSNDARLRAVAARRDAWLQARQDMRGEWAQLLRAWPDTADARRALIQTQQACVEAAMTRIALTRADDCLILLAAASANADAALATRERLATLWLGVGEERLGRGERGAARDAIAAAWFWAPNLDTGDALWQRAGGDASRTR